MARVPANLSNVRETGLELGAQIRRAAKAAGMSPGAFVKRSNLSPLGNGWLLQLETSAMPTVRTIDRVRRACAGEILGRVELPNVRKPGARGNVSKKDNEAELIAPERLEALRAASEVRARIAKVGLGAGAATGREILISADLWRRVVAEADACGRAPAAMLIEAVEMGLLASAEERLEREREIAA